MKLLKRVGVGLLLVVGGFVLFLVLSVAVDSWVGRERVAQLTNTEVPGDAVPAVAAYVARPEGPGPFPAVIMLHEFWGLQPELIGKAEALADEGYVVIAPDMYRGQATGWLPRAIYLAITVPEARVLGDLAPVYTWLAAQPEVDPAAIVVMGFCYGGGKALQFSLVNEELAGTGVFYGALESDPAVLSRLPGPVLGVFGAEDAAPSPAEVAQFQMGLEAAGIPHEITVYEGVGHAFVKDMEGIRQGGAQGEAWAQFLAWLARTVG
jgi:carboxymethylenebutenolidase